MYFIIKILSRIFFYILFVIHVRCRGIFFKLHSFHFINTHCDFIGSKGLSRVDKNFQKKEGHRYDSACDHADIFCHISPCVPIVFSDQPCSLTLKLFLRNIAPMCEMYLRINNVLVTSDLVKYIFSWINNPLALQTIRYNLWTASMTHCFFFLFMLTQIRVHEKSSVPRIFIWFESG